MTHRDNDIVPLPSLLLASASPRRSFLLKNLGVHFQTAPASIEEKQKKNELPKEFAERMALEKALSPRVDSTEIKKGPLYSLGADTIVVLKNKIFGKPKDPKEAANYLRQLSGMTHEVITGFAIVQLPAKIIKKGSSLSRVIMKTMTEREIEAYIQTGEPLDKAGAYAAQGKAQKFIKKIEGSVTNVIGLPMEEITPWLEKLGLVQKNENKSSPH